MILDRPGSKRAAGVVGVLAALAVVLNIVLISCQGEGGSTAGRRAEAGAARGSRAKSGTVRAPAPATTLPTPAAPAGVAVVSAGEPEMRVRVLAGVESVPVACGAGLLAASGDANPLLASGTGAGQAVGPGTTVTLRAGFWVLTGGAGEQARLGAAQPLIVSPGRDGANLGLGGASYAGRLRLSVRSDVSDRAFDVVEFVRLEEYLPGVVAKELPSGWPLETYRVQAVCARTYAMQERQRSINMGDTRFDVEATDRDQVYGGVTGNLPAIEAVRSTRGQVVFAGDQLLRAYFSSTCGGRTGAARDTWPVGPGFEYNLAEPIQSHPRDHACQSSPLYRWTVVRDRAELVRRIRAYGEKTNAMVRRIKDLAAVEPMALNADQRPSRYKVIEPGGTWYTLSAEELRLACNTEVPAGMGMPTTLSASGGVGPGGSVGVSAVNVTFATAPVGGGGQAMPAVAAIERKTRVNSGDLEFKVAGNSVTISGRGFGHGVGMCQFCAKGFAERGEDWRTMVGRFYPGARIGPAY